MRNTALLQAWLYFGILSTILNYADISIDIQTLLLKRSDGSKRISCSAVARLLDLWDVHVEATVEKESWESHSKFCERTLSIALRNVRYHDFDNPRSKQPSATQHRAVIILSIKALIRAFSRKIYKPRKRVRMRSEYFTDFRHLSELTGSMRLLDDATVEDPSPSAKLACDILISHGWCPTLTRVVLLEEEIENVFLADSIKGNLACDSTHDQCNDFQGCLAANVDGKISSHFMNTRTVNAQ